MPTKMTSEIFSIANGISDINQRAEYLRTNASQAVKELINVNFNPEIKILLPEGTPEFLLNDEKPPTYDDASLNYEVRRLYLFVEGGSPNLTDMKRETIWVELLKSLHKDEADDLTHMKDRILQKKYKNLTLLDSYCPHRGANLFFGRNEDCGLRCVYHGWKFDVDGKAVDLPNVHKALPFTTPFE